MDFNSKHDFEHIDIPSNLDEVINIAVEKARKHNKKIRIRNSLLKINAAIAAVLLIFIFTVNTSPAFAKSIVGIPVISSISNAVTFHYDKNIANAEKQNVEEAKQNKGIGISINNIVADDKDLFILYTLNGEASDNDLKNLILEKFSLMDSRNNVILSSNDFKAQMVPEKVEGKASDVLTVTNKQYKCIISSMGNSLEDYSKNKKTFGSLELQSLTEDSTIPGEISLNISSVAEAYTEAFSRQNNINFTSKFNREPVSISGQWDFNLRIDNSLKLKKPEVYNNIKFTVDNTDFNIEYLKIYPTHIDTRIKLGQNKLDKSQCWSIGRVVGTDKRFPYLIDENGNKYVISGNVLTNIDSEKCINLTFESSYFNKSKELYLVISQLNYNTGAPFKNIEPVKLKIK